jgi:hypothetical protein
MATPEATGKPKRLAAQARRRKWVAIWLLIGLATVAGGMSPVRSTLARLALIAGVAGVWGGALALSWRIRWLRVFGLALAAMLGALLVLPGRPHDPARLRDQYVKSLVTYDSTRYVWGGETGRGIDCSGLIRSALVDATLRQGLVTLNPCLLRQALTVWWHDSSAAGLKEGYGGRTAVLTTSPSLNALDPSLILPGDFAVTSNGVHALAYLGRGKWIEADPVAKRVLTVETPTEHVWFTVPVHVMRWHLMESGSASD